MVNMTTLMMEEEKASIIQCSVIQLTSNELLIYSGLTFQLSFLTKLNSKITRAL